MARTFGSWLSGPPVPEPATPGDADYPGQRLGLPAQGTGSLVGFARRFFALLIDWLIAYGLGGLAVALGWFGQGALSTAVLAIWIVVGAVSVRLFGFTPGQVAVGIQVASVDHRIHVGIGRALVRGVLVALVIPPLFTDSDGRGLQDKATGTAVVRR
ncbi:RDD family protein [Mycolicibacterium arenosum]|uniref:RDD family protein n=1 Tax=Mycolicibacterium arenosum TaxID=2952157 RepID=A0ABT1MDD0_9MYCO|nr:RDD family protein [Mycolicibacterium sp. CAU 1645]MCP9276407.1 RDD family protein [Mycolicibacterium sp. CAU 1645]